MKIISSKDNPIIKETASLKDKKYRDAFELYLVEGPNLVKELIDSSPEVERIFIKDNPNQEISQIIQSLKSDRNVIAVPDELFAKLSSDGNPQGIMAVAKKRKYETEEFISLVGAKNILVLDRIQDPGNMGTLLRTSEAMGFGGIIFIKGCTDPYQSKVVRAAAGSLRRMPMLFADSGEETIELLEKANKKVYSACMQGDISIENASLKENTAIIIGNEGNGVDKFLQNKSTKLFIPMEGELESLNAAVAACIIMYESKRQRS